MVTKEPTVEQIKEFWKRVHVISRGKSWVVKKEGNSKVTRIYKDKKSAVSDTRKLIRNGYDVVIHKRDGSVQKWERL